VRPRWQEWVIALALIALGVTGIWTIWGNDLADLLHPERAERTDGVAGSAPGQGAAPSGSRSPPTPAGPAQGPF
jgi:hypothetical protein